MNTLLLNEANLALPNQGTNQFIYRIKLGIIASLFLLLFIQSGTLLRYLDPAAAALDIGMLSFLPLAAIAIIGFTAIALWLQSWLWPVFRHYKNNHFSEQFKDLTTWQKVKSILLSYYALLFFIALVLMALL